MSEVTGFPELMGGRLKTLHPRIHGGLLARRNDAGDLAEAETHGIAPIDLLVVNLYPFEQTVASGASAAASIESIDIGGPAMIRAAAKNYAGVTVIVDPDDYPALEAELGANDGATTGAFRARMAGKAFARTAAYDSVIAAWLASKTHTDTPAWRTVGGRLKQSLRYGENPHQSAAFYATGDPRPGVATAVLRQGKALSFNNLNDADAAFELAAEFPPDEQAAAVIVKHANPCGVALGPSLVEAYRKALACDPVSAFGGVIALNRPLDEETAREIVRLFTEVVIAPGASEGAGARFAAKANLRLLTTAELPDPRTEGILVRSVAGGLLVQSRDTARFGTVTRTVVTKRSPTPAEWRDLAFALTVVKHVKSNAIVLAKGGATVGIGAGQMSRVDAVRMAVVKANEVGRAAGEVEPRSRGVVGASDAFFPFPDGLEALADAGATAVIQPGGAARDGEVIAAADLRQLAMVVTGVRHFRH